jgi:hypothetical protein
MPLSLTIPLYSTDGQDLESDVAPWPLSLQINLDDSDDDYISSTPDIPPGPPSLRIGLYETEDTADLLEPPEGLFYRIVRLMGRLGS